LLTLQEEKQAAPRGGDCDVERRWSRSADFY
jgi:hypothetical protein